MKLGGLTVPIHLFARKGGFLQAWEQVMSTCCRRLPETGQANLFLPTLTRPGIHDQSKVREQSFLFGCTFSYVILGQVTTCNRPEQDMKTFPFGVLLHDISTMIKPLPLTTFLCSTTTT